MAKTAAQRQADYRTRLINSGASADGDRRLNMWISTGASLSLTRLAAHEGVSKRVIIERLVQLADQKLMTPSSPTPTNGTIIFWFRRLRSNGAPGRLFDWKF